MVRALFSVRMLAMLFCAASLWLVDFGKAEAGLLQYTLTSQGTITGTLNGTAFTDKTFSMTETADTSNIVSGTFDVGPFTIYTYSLPGTVTITIDGIPTATFVSTTDMRALSESVYLSGSVFENAAGFADFSSSVPTGVGPSTGSTFYDLTTPFSASGLANSQQVTWHTSSGDLVITSSVTGTTTFTAATVPEPSSFALGPWELAWRC